MMFKKNENHTLSLLESSSLHESNPSLHALTKSKSHKQNQHLSCTLNQEDKELLIDLALYASNKKKKVINTSQVIRALIRMGSTCKDKIDF